METIIVGVESEHQHQCVFQEIEKHYSIFKLKTYILVQKEPDMQGGIVSATMDGVNCVNAIATLY